MIRQEEETETPEEEVSEGDISEEVDENSQEDSYEGETEAADPENGEVVESVIDEEEADETNEVVEASEEETAETETLESEAAEQTTSESTESDESDELNESNDSDLSEEAESDEELTPEEESLSDEYSEDEYSDEEYSDDDYLDDNYSDEGDNDSQVEEDESADIDSSENSEENTKRMPRARLVDDSVYEYEKAIIDDLKQEDVSRYVDVDEETYEPVEKKKRHIVPLVLLVLVSSVALAAAILAATGHLGELVNTLNEQFSAGNQPSKTEGTKLPEQSSDEDSKAEVSSEPVSEKESSSESDAVTTSSSAEESSSSTKNNNENAENGADSEAGADGELMNQTSNGAAADTAAVSDSAENLFSEAETETEAETEAETQDKPAVQSEFETQTKTVAEVESESETESTSEQETEKNSESESSSENESELASESESETAKLETETETETEKQTVESESEAESKTAELETEAESETETAETKIESETEEETESESSEEVSEEVNPYHEAAKAKYPSFSNESYTLLPDVSSGCIYAKYTKFDEAFNTLYTNQSDLTGAAQVAVNTPGFNIIGYRVYMLAYQDNVLNAYSTQLDGTDLQLSAQNVGEEAYIMNGSIFSENREYSMTGNPEGTAYPYIERFLTFGEGMVYYLDTDGDITRSDYQHTYTQRLELGIDDGRDVAWAQVIGPYLIYYDTKTELMYSCNLDVGTLVLLDFDGVAAPSGLCGNGNWVYGLYDGNLSRVRPNGSELETVFEPDDSLELVSVEHAMEDYIILTAKEADNKKAEVQTYSYNLQTGELSKLSAE